jgi:TPR repeat protein
MTSVGRVAVSLVVTVAAGSTAWALDPDIAFQIRTRRAEVTPFCPALLFQKTPLSLVQTYQKAMCLLYGIQAPEQAALALDMLRQVAPQWPDALLALADALQDGTAPQQQEALQWYASAAATGDVRASARHARLAQRIDAAKAVDVPTPISDADPFADPLSSSDPLPPGYHCHFYGLGKKVCHGAGFD